MKARITHLKAPWPSGAEVGSVVSFYAGAIPAWAAGKCVEVAEDDDTVVSHLITPLTELEVVEQPRDLAAELALAESRIEKVKELAGITYENLRADHAAELSELQGKLSAMTAERDLVAEELAAARAQLASATVTEEGKAQAAQAEAEAKAAQERADGSKKGKAK